MDWKFIISISFFISPLKTALIYNQWGRFFTPRAMDNMNRYPFYLKFNLVLFLLFLLGSLIVIGQDIIAPLAFSVLLSILLLPANKFLEKRKVSLVPSILISLTLALIFIAVIVYVLSMQITNFTEDTPAIKKHLNDHYITVQTWVCQTFHFTLREQTKFIDNAKTN